MTVFELIQILQDLPPDLPAAVEDEVYGYREVAGAEPFEIDPDVFLYPHHLEEHQDDPDSEIPVVLLQLRS